MHLIVYTQSSDPVPATFDGLPVTLQPNSSVVIMPSTAVIAGQSVTGVTYATILVGNDGAFATYPHANPMVSFGQGFGVGCGLLGFVILISISKLLSKHSPDF